MFDRIPKNPGRVKITPESGGAAYYATMERADNPTQEGTPLNKETLLTDETAALYGLENDAVPNEVFAAVKNLLENHEVSINGRAQIVYGTYTGTGTYGSSNPNTLTFDFVPKIIFFGDGRGTGFLNKWIVGSGSTLIVYDGDGASLSNTGGYQSADASIKYRTSVISISGTTISWYSSSTYTSEYNAQCAQMNYSRRKYYYIAIG